MRALVNHWVDRGKPDAALLRACTTPLNNDEAWMRFSGEPRPKGSKDSEAGLSRLIGATLDTLRSAGGGVVRCYNCLDCLKEALNLSAMLGRAEALGELLRQIQGDHSLAWQATDNNDMVLLLCRAVFGRSTDAVALLIDDIARYLTAGCFRCARDDATVSVRVHVGHMLESVRSGQAAAYAPAEVVNCIFFNAMMQLQGISNSPGVMSTFEFNCRMFSAVRACSNAVVSGTLVRDTAPGSSRAILLGVVKHIRHRMPDDFVDVCLMQAANVIIRRQASDPLIRFVSSGLAASMGTTYIVVTGILCASISCLRVVLSMPEARQVAMAPGFMRSAVLRAAGSGQAERLVALIRFWDVGAEGRAAVLHEALRTVKSVACAQLIKWELDQNPNPSPSRVI